MFKLTISVVTSIVLVENCIKLVPTTLANVNSRTMRLVVSKFTVSEVNVVLQFI